MSTKRSAVRRFLDRVFDREDISDPAGNGGLYMERWIVGRLFGCALYIHRFERSDWARALHDHPRAFWTLPLIGGYFDNSRVQSWRDGRCTYMGYVRRELVRWPWPKLRPATHLHRVELDARWPHPWTLVLMLRKTREWGFAMEDGTWVRWDVYCAMCRIEEATGVMPNALIAGTDIAEGDILTLGPDGTAIKFGRRLEDVVSPVMRINNDVPYKDNKSLPFHEHGKSQQCP